MNISVFEGIFGLKSQIFITAEFILRHESGALTLPERQNIYSPRRRKDAKSDVRFSPAWIFICATVVVLPFRQKLAGELKASTAMNISVFEGVFGLKSQIFITAEFILRGESAALTLPGRQNIYSPRRRKDRKSDFRFSPASIFICATAVVLPFRQKLAGELKVPTVMDMYRE